MLLLLEIRLRKIAVFFFESSKSFFRRLLLSELATHGAYIDADGAEVSRIREAELEEERHTAGTRFPVCGDGRDGGRARGAGQRAL